MQSIHAGTCRVCCGYGWHGGISLGADDVAALTAILEALTVIQEDQLSHRPPEIVFAVAEEPHTIGSHQLDFSRLSAKEAYVLDMDGKIGTAALQAPSILYFQAKFVGKSAHAGMTPELGIHAIGAAAWISGQAGSDLWRQR